MTALAHKEAFAIAPKTTDATSIETGAGVEMFVSGSAPAGTDMMAGDGLDLVVTSILGTAADTDQ